jgi:hypothetical protein
MLKVGYVYYDIALGFAIAERGAWWQASPGVQNTVGTGD